MSKVQRWFFQLGIASAMTVSVAAVSTRIHAQEPDGVQSFLTEGRLSDAASAMQERLREAPDDENARFSLGMIQFFQAVEGLGQDQYRFGLLAQRQASLPFMRLPVGANKKAETITYEKARALIQRFVDGLQQAEATLKEVKPANVRLPINVGTIHLDLNNDGEVVNTESIWFISQTLQNPRRTAQATPPKEFPIVFDAGDVPWLRGYCQALSALGEIVLAHDWKDQFERTAHLFYPKVETPYKFLTAEGTGVFFSFGSQNILDLIALVHTVNYEPVEPERLKTALAHMEKVIELSRESWDYIEAEDDDEREWVPNANQTTVMKGFVVGRDTISGWHQFLDQMEAILKGEKLAPFWRGIKGGVAVPNSFPRNPTIGINVRRIFTNPQRFDLALWLQGTGLLPFLEEGEIVDPEEWNQMMSSFRGNFFNYFFWFN